ncbi:amidohydrolase [Corynebacterium caspium]|uniref:amidohydrolase n=1 Tax=Corynebacterium caspium TaxID=234828 RepID=UPI00036ACD0A|nr:amidohydrolase [Corynebacterium caspium]WKD59038.1 putative hydrolase YxeP [Corynebacterium caspium DSM 44850]
MLKNLISELFDSAAAQLSFQRELYEELHAMPELSGQEASTAKRIRAELARFDCEIIDFIGGHGLVGIFRNGPGKTVLMRADFDGLPVLETTGVPYASKHTQLNEAGVETPTMHACGHDMHVTATMGLCALLDSHREAWQGTFIALFQPSEENGMGALKMIEDDLVHKIPTPDICFGQHIMPGRAGEVHSISGPIMATAVSIKINIPGISAHGSMPHKSVDPTYVAAMVLVRLQGIVGREVSPHDFAVVTVGTLKAGNASNIIPGHAEIVLNCRFYDPAVREKVIAAIERVVRAECLASNCPAEPSFDYFSEAPLTNNNEAVFDTVRPEFDAVFGPLSVTAQKSTGSEDFSRIPVAFDAPYMFWFIGCTPHQVWDTAIANDTLDTTVPVNHMSTFLPEYEPTVTSATKAAATAVLTYLAK